MYGFATMVKKALFHSILPALLLVCGLFFSSVAPARAVDLPLAAGSPLAGISFDDRPLMLPVQRNFQMAMLLASSELGRSCGKMEAYGWRLGENEQNRVNQIFNNTVDRFRALGFNVETQSADSVSSDITLFTADRTDKHMISLWSAGEIGLVLVLCETSAPLSPIPDYAMKKAEASKGLGRPTALAPTRSVVEDLSHLSERTAQFTNNPVQVTRTGKPVYEKFTPVGAWVGSYACAQGTTGAMLDITSLKGDQFEGVFHFYPTMKNSYIPKGSYKVFGEYDADSQRILINPGKWIDRPENYYNTIMIGSFDPADGSFSGYFQGIAGCTSFEARYQESASKHVSKKETKKVTPKKAKKKSSKKKVVKKKLAPKVEPETTIELAPEPVAAPLALTPDPLAGIAVEETTGAR